jgi:hypothetical protein
MSLQRQRRTPERDAEILRRFKERGTTRGLAEQLGLPPALVTRVVYREREDARAAMTKAVRADKLKRASHCDACGSGGRIHGHHPDYSQPLLVEWLCVPCHAKADNVARIKRALAKAGDTETAVEDLLAIGQAEAYVGAPPGEFGWIAFDLRPRVEPVLHGEAWKAWYHRRDVRRVRRAWLKSQREQRSAA